MATNRYIRGLTRQGFRVPKTGGGFAWVKIGGNSQVNIDDHAAQLVLAGNRNTAGFIRVSGSGSTTATIVGLSRRGFRIRNSGGSFVVCKVGSGATTVDLTNGRALRSLVRNKRDWAFASDATNLLIKGIQNAQNGFEVRGQTGDTITSNNTNVSNADTVVVGSKTYTFKTNLTEAKASGTITTSSTGAANNDTVTVGSITYTFKTTLTGAANEVLRTGVIDVDLTNLRAAINGSAGAGTTYGTGTVANASVTCGAVSAHAVTITAAAVGTAGNSIALTKSSTNVTVSGSGTLSGGVAAVANEIKIGGSADASLTNLSEAINGGANIGTDYSTGTTANADATASTVASHAITLTAVEGGSGTVTVSTTASTLTVAHATLADSVQKIYRGVSATIDATLPFNYQQLRRHYDRWIEG